KQHGRRDARGVQVGEPVLGGGRLDDPPLAVGDAPRGAVPAVEGRKERRQEELVLAAIRRPQIVKNLAVDLHHVAVRVDHAEKLVMRGSSAPWWAGPALARERSPTATPTRGWAQTPRRPA